jgi:hypothetical protein
MNLHYEVQEILGQAGYYIRVANPAEGFDFEDETLYGFVKICPSAEAIVENWQKEQDDFLARYARCIRANPPKAWNAYSVFLTAVDAPSDVKLRLCQIEEDFRGTRKIAKSNLTTVNELTEALYPLLPLANRVQLARTGSPKLKERLTSLSAIEIEALLKLDLREIITAAQLEKS